MSTLGRCTLLAALLAFSSCAGDDTTYPQYFAFDGTQTFVGSRNVAGRNLAEIEARLDEASDAGTTLVRFHVTHAFGPGITASGGVDEAWAAQWDAVFAYAEENGMHVLPVFGVWADWNDGSAGEAWHVWHENPLNVVNGGPASSPAELYRAGSPGQKAWLGWVRSLVTRWQGRPNVAAWEVFSELDLVTPSGTEVLSADALAFLQAAAREIRGADGARRPVTASVSGWWDRWPELYASSAVDLVQVHLYSPGENLGDRILQVGRALRSYGKPMLLGETGLDFRAPDGSTATTGAYCELATHNAVWAALVSGFMNGRALWWEDGYAILQNGESSVPFVRDYEEVERGATAFVAGRDMSRMRPLEVDTLALEGGAVGDDRTVLAWFHDDGCDYPVGWPATSCALVHHAYTVRIEAPGGAATWQATFHDTATGAARGEPVTVARDGGWVAVPLPDFAGDIAIALSAND